MSGGYQRISHVACAVDVCLHVGVQHLCGNLPAGLEQEPIAHARSSFACRIQLDLYVHQTKVQTRCNDADQVHTLVVPSLCGRVEASRVEM